MEELLSLGFVGVYMPCTAFETFRLGFFGGRFRALECVEV